MIIAGFSGVGKTYFCENTKNAIDFIIMPFKYSNFYEVSRNYLSEGEDIKANPDLEFVVGWEEYYYHALVDTYRRFPEQIIVIPTVVSILEKLKQDHIPVTVVYLNAADKKEYAKRYKNRGNSEDFMEIFLERWDEWIKAVQNHVSDNAIELSAEQYLSDLIETVPYDENTIIKNKESYIYDTYFKNGLEKSFVETPIGELIERFGVYR